MERFELVRGLVRLKQILSLFPHRHPLVQERAKQFLGVIKTLREEENQAEMSIIDKEVYVNRHSLRRESLESVSLVRQITNTRINSFSFAPDTTVEELISLMSYLNECQQTDFVPGLLSEELQAKGITHITVARILPLEISGKEEELMGRFLKPKSEYQRAVSGIESIFTKVMRGSSFRPESVSLIVQGLLKKVIKDEVALSGLFNIKNYEDCTFRHSVNVALLSLLMGKRLKLDRELLAILGEAALLHDIGKIMIPKEVITKPGCLNRMEWEIIYRHPFVGAEILLTIPGISSLTPGVALGHHVYYDGSGYPSLAVGGEDNHLNYIVSLGDVYDALTTVRSYRRPMFPTQAILQLLRGAGTQFNPVLVKVFVSVVGFYPIGTLVRTDQGEVGVVTAVNPEDSLHPIIKILPDEQGKKSAPQLIDTSRKSSLGAGYLRNISQVLTRQALSFEERVSPKK